MVRQRVGASRTGSVSPDRSARGFTLIELSIVVAIIVTLSTITVPVFLSVLQDARVEGTTEDMRVVQTEIQMFINQKGELPDSLDDIGLGHLRDPWGRPYVYTRIDGGKTSNVGELRKDRFLVPINSDYDLYSMGPDGKSASALTANISHDDIIRANDGAYFGPASEY